MLRIIEDYLSKDNWRNELVFVFGNCDVDGAIPAEYVHRIPNAKFVKAEKLCSRIDDKMFESGLTMVADESVGIKDGQALQNFQAHLISEYYKKSFFQKRMPYKPSPPIQSLLGGLKDPSRSMSQMYNMPWLLRFPLADKLEDMRIGLPVMILMAGPSLNAIKTHLKSLARRFLIVCIGRSLQPCLEAGVEPDFVVQYDTNLEQKLFYDKIKPLKNTVLVSLSSAYISEYAWKFRGVIFRASFNSMLLQNPFVLRDSTESSLMACMGLAEVLRAPEAMISGADLSWPMEQGQYCSIQERTNIEAAKTEDYRILQNGHDFMLVDRTGKRASSNVGYLAAAGRAMEFSREIKAKTDVHFFLTSNAGILPQKEFPASSLDAMLAFPALDRDAYSEKIDAVLNAKERIDLMHAIQFFNNQSKFLDIQELNFRIREHNQDSIFELHGEFISLMKNMRTIIFPPMKDNAHARNMVKRWAHAYKHATKISLAYFIAKEESLPVLCLDSEYDLIQDNIDGFFPKEHLEIIVTSCLVGGNQSQHVRIEDVRLAKWLEDQKIVFISPAVLERYKFLFDFLEDDNIIPLPQF